MDYKRLFKLVFVFTIIGTPVFSQFHLPPLEIQIKGGITGREIEYIRPYTNGGGQTDHVYYEYIAPTVSADINWNITQHFAAGAYWVMGIPGNNNYKWTDSNWSTSGNGAASHQEYGIKLRGYTGRARTLRPFVEIAYGKWEMYIEQNGYRMANSTAAFGTTLGLMIKLGSKLYLVLPQLNVRFRSEPFYFESNNQPFLEIVGGLSYNLGKRK